MESKKILMLAGKGSSTNILYNAINTLYPINTVVIEEKESKKVFIKRRIKKLGLLTVIGQVMFQLIIVRLLNLVSGKRIRSIITENKLNEKEVKGANIIYTKSVNDDSVIDLVKRLQPDVVIVNGTRIISKK